jgi:NAD dependent epimerase/dehydratase family enzyme
VNATAPYAVPNSTFTGTLGRVLDRPTFLPLPALALKALLGEMGKEMLLQGQRVQPTVAEKTGFEFMYPGLEESLRHQLGRATSP